MATFMQGVTDQFGPLQLHTPDYSFLMQAYGTKQAQYDRGFNMVKNLYNSVLNSPVTNGENEEFRKNAFAKVQDALKSVSGVDLSDPTVVKKAMAIMDPISNDKDLAYDMAVTRHHQQQRQMMESYKNSTDPEKRKLYDQHAERYLQNGEEELRTARRGTGEITNVRPKDFVIFDDVMGFLNETATKQGLKIEKSMAPGDGYIYKVTNGQGAVIPFYQWATAQMGNRFDRQFQVMGEVQADAGVKAIMESTGTSKENARQIYAKQLFDPMMEKIAKQGEEAQTQLDKVERTLSLFTSKYGNAEPKDPVLLEQWNSLQQNKKAFSSELENLKQRSADLQMRGLDYVNNNMAALFAEEAKKQNALNWANSRATTTESVDIKTDSATISKWQMQNSRSIAFAQIQAANDRQNKELALRSYEADRNFDLNVEKFKWEQEKENNRLELDYYKTDAKGLAGSGTDTKGGKNASYMTEIGTYLSPAPPASAVSMLSQALTMNNPELFTSSFDPGKGLMGIVVTDRMKHGEYYGALNRLREFVSGGDPLSEQEIKTINDYGKIVNVNKVTNLDKRQAASYYLDALSAGTLNTAKEMSKDYAAIKSKGDLFRTASAYENAISTVTSIFNEREEIRQDMARMQSLVMENGKMKEAFKKEGLKIAGKFSDADQTIMFDTSNMTSEGLKMLEHAVGPQFKDRTNPVGKIYSLQGMTDAEVFSMVNPNIVKSVTFSGDKLKSVDLGSMSAQEFKESFGNNARVMMDPNTKEMTIELSVSMDGALGKKKKIVSPEKMSVTIPFESVMANPSLKRLADAARANMVNPRSLGKAAPFLSNPYSEIKASEYIRNSGFDYSVFGADTPEGFGIYVNLSSQDEDGNWIYEPTTFIPIADPDNPSSWTLLDKAIESSFSAYRMSAEQAEAKYRNLQFKK
jgi:hypothetical protein